MSHHSPMDLRKRTLILIASLIFTLNTSQSNYAQAKSRSNHHDINSRDLTNSYHESNSSQNEESNLREVIARPNYKIEHGNNDTRLSNPSITSIATVLSQEDSGKPSFCITTPQNMSFCSSKLAWAPTMAMPNLLGHRSEDELNAFLSLYPLQDLTSVKCKASHHFKLLLCSVLTPVCLDASLIPCRHLCIAAKSSCESAFKRQGLEWPRFLDCRRFPRKNQNDNCIERQPALISTNSQMTTCIHDRHELNSTKPSVKRKQKEKKNRSKPAMPGKTTLTTSTTGTTTETTTSTTTATPTISAKSSSSSENLVTKEDNLSSYPTTPGDNFDSSTLSSLDNRSSLVTTETIKTIITTTTTTTATPLSTTVSKDLANTTSQSVATIANTISLQEMKSQSNNESTMNLNVPTTPEENFDTFRQDYSSIPSNVTNDLTQLICSTSPDWLIKTKLSDGQLVNAVQRRNLKVRSYLQIFGSLANKDGAISSTTQPPDSRKSVRTNLHLELSNTTVFVYPLAANLYTQPISEASKSNQDSTKFKSTIRYYLIAGTGTNDTVKSTNVFILWPSGKVSTSPDFQGSINVIKTYREFKHKGLRVCNHQGRKQLSRSSNQVTNLTEFDGHNTQGGTSPNYQENQSSNRYRRNKKKRVQTTVSE